MKKDWIISVIVTIVILLVGCISTDNDKQRNSEEIEIQFIDDVFYNSSILLNYHYQVRLNFSNYAIEVINLSLDDFKLVTKFKTYIADKSPNIPAYINKSETKNFVVSFDTDDNEQYDDFIKVIYESNRYGLFYELPIPK